MIAWRVSVRLLLSPGSRVIVLNVLDAVTIARMRTTFDAAAVAAFERWAPGLTHRGDDDPASGIP